MFARQIDGPFLKENVGPLANFTYRVDGTKIHVDASKSVDLSGEGLVLYEWLWGDDMNDTEPIQAHRYKKSGEYNITLRVTNALGMRSSAYQIVKIEVKEGVDYCPGIGIIAAIILIIVVVVYLLRRRTIHRLMRKGR
jgi:hypothetical protein